MKGSPYAKDLEDRITQWEDWLNYTLNFFTYWVKVQGVWLYLEPVFNSPDITKKLPQQGLDFEQVDKYWKEHIMGKIVKDNHVIEFTKDRKMLEILKECNMKLESVQKGLNGYLEAKRISFPRFFFLGNDELIEILAETKDPRRVDPHLKKCFEGIKRLKFDSQNKISAMYSSENEMVLLNFFH